MCSLRGMEHRTNTYRCEKPLQRCSCYVLLCAVNIDPPRDPISSVPPLSLQFTAAEQAARLAFLLRILSQVTMAISYLMCAIARKRVGENEAAAADVRKALDWLDRIAEELRAETRRDDAREVRLRAEHAAACAAAEAEAEAAVLAAEAAVAMAAAVLADRAARMAADVIPMPARAGVMQHNETSLTTTRMRSFGPRAACSALAVPRFGGWCAPSWDRVSKTGFASGVYACL